jgi:hypothetical protein
MMNQWNTNYLWVHKLPHIGGYNIMVVKGTSQ